MADRDRSLYSEGYRLGLRHALTGRLTLICDGGPETAQERAGYWAGYARGRELVKRHLEREAEAELEAGL